MGLLPVLLLAGNARAPLEIERERSMRHAADVRPFGSTPHPAVKRRRTLLLVAMFALGGLIAFEWEPVSGASAGTAAPQLETTLRFDTASPVEVTGRGVKDAKPGTTVEVTFEAKIDRGWHIYSVGQDPDGGTPTSIEVTQNPMGFTAFGDVQEPTPKVRRDPVLEVILSEHEGNVTFRVPVQVPKNTPAGTHSLPAVFTYLACDAERCLVPHRLQFNLAIQVAGSLVVDSVPSGTGEAATTKPVPTEPIVLRPDAAAPVEVSTHGFSGVRAGQELEIDLVAKIDRGWHIYGLGQSEERGVPARIEVGSSPFERAGSERESAPHVFNSDNMGGEMEEHEGQATFTVPIRVPADIVPGAHVIPVTLHFQMCDAEMCLDPTSVSFKVPITVGSGAPAAATPPGAVTPTESMVARAAPESPVEISTHGFAGVRAGQELEIELVTKIDRGWHIYGLGQSDERGVPARIEVGSSPFERAGSERESPAHVFNSDTMGGEMEEHEGTATFTVPIRVPDDIAPGAHVLPVTIHYQVCDAEMCLDPTSVTFDVPIIIGAVAVVGGGSADSVADSTAAVKTIVGRENPASQVEVSSESIVGIVPGTEITIQLKATIDRGWHIYGLHQNEKLGIPTVLKLVAPRFGAVSEAVESKPYIYDDPQGQEMQIHEGSATFSAAVQVPADLPDGTYMVEATLHYQVCADTCLDPAAVTLQIPVTVGSEVAAIPTGTGLNGAEDDSAFTFTAKLDKTRVAPGDLVTFDFEGNVVAPEAVIPAIQASALDKAKSGGIWGIIWASILGALVALITPCVYPMIPITVSVFTKQAEQNKSGVLGLAIIFCAGIIVTFTGIGFGLAVVMGEQGATFMASNGWVNLLLGTLFVVFAFSLFGYYDISLPSWLTNRATGAGTKGGVLSVILMGFVFSITTFTCVGPIVATLLALAVQGGQVLALIGMLAFGATFALPFFFLALFPKMLSSMPRSGGWLNNVKVVLGFVELAAAFKFFAVVPHSLFSANLLFRELVLFFWAIIFALTSAYLLGLFKFKLDSPIKKRGPIRLAFVFLFVGFTAYCLYGSTGRMITPTLEAQLMKSFFHDPGGHSEEKSEEERSTREAIVAGIRGSDFWSKVFETDPSDLPWTVFSKDSPGDVEATIASLDTGRPIFLNFTGHT